MRRMGMAMLMMTAMAVSVAAQTSMQRSMAGPSTGDRAAVEKAIVANENLLNNAFAKKDVATMKAHIADDAVMAEATGVMTVADMLKMLPTMDVKVTEQTLSNFKFVWADANTVVVTYTWTGKGMANGQPMPPTATSSTVWTKRGTKWVAIFHQESTAR